MLKLILFIICGVARQTDWMGGSGILGPVDDWGTQYYQSDSVTTAIAGQVSLVATRWNYSNWVPHIVETNNWVGDQGFMPADIDGNGIKDLVAHVNDRVIWYYNSGNYTFTPNIVGPADDGGSVMNSVFPYDLDQDNDIDVLVATEGIGLGWFENIMLTWTWHSIDNTIGYHRAIAVDVENDNDIDIIAADNSIGIQRGDIWLFRNNGSQTFTKELIVDFSGGGDGWRHGIAYFNNDGYPDLYVGIDSAVIYINDGTGRFTRVFSTGSYRWDGMWPSDINMDGYVDLVCGRQWATPYAFYALLNDGTGTNFTIQMLNGTNIGQDYTDGGMALDVDLDGFPDIVGCYTRVGWYRQDPNNLLNFTPYSIDNTSRDAHWIYGGSISMKCSPSIDLCVTDREKAHIVYENKMIESFASNGYIESSILRLDTAITKICSLYYFGYNACVPNDSALSFYWRSGIDSASLINASWDGPHFASIGMNIVDSVRLNIANKRVFQYKAEFRGDTNDIAVLYEVWLNYACQPLSIEENKIKNKFWLKPTINGAFIMHIPYDDKISLKVYNISGRLLKELYNGIISSGTYELKLQEKAGVYFIILTHSQGKEKLKYTTIN